MSALDRDVAEALASALQAIKDERETHALALDNLAAVVRAAAQLFAGADLTGSHGKIREALDLAHELLGEADSIEPLAAMLGYVEGGAS